MSNVIELQSRKRPPISTPATIIVDVKDAGVVRFDSIDDALEAMRAELRAGRGFAATVRPAPPDELEPEHAQ